jgi:glycosyltransferase involved in cell wall biosynthesis
MKLSIAIFAHSYLPVSGGIQTYIHSNAVELAKLGNKVNVIVPNNGLDLPPYEEIDGVGVHRTSVQNIYWNYPVEDNAIGGWETNEDHAGWASQIVKTLMESLRIIRAEDVNVVHTHFTATPVGELLYLYHNIPYVDSIHGFYTDYFPSRDMLQGAKNFYTNGNVNKIVVLSNYVKKHCMNGGLSESMIEVVNPSVDLKKFNHKLGGDTLRKKLALKPDDKIILSPIRLQRRKGFETAMMAMPLVLQKYPNAHLVITGGSSANPAGIDKPLGIYHKLIEDLSLYRNVHLLLNQVTTAQMPYLYASADIVFMPSTHEGFGISSIEAQAMKNPVIASSIEPFQEALYDTAIFFEPQNHKEAAEAIIKVLDSPRLEQDLIERGYNRVLEKYNPTKLAKKMEKVYKNAIRGNR